MTAHPKVLLRTAIDPAALLDHASNRDRQVHRVVVEELRHHGIMVVAKDEKKALYDAINRLAPDSAELWEATIKALDQHMRVSHYAGALSVSDSLESSSLGAIWKKALLDLVIAGEDNASPHGVNYSTGVSKIGETDLVLAATIDRSSALEKAKSVGTFPPGTPRSDVAEQLLRPLATYSSVVKIIDPFILENFIRFGTKSENVEWLLGVLAESLPPGASVSLLSKVHDGWPREYMSDPEERITEMLTRVLSKRTTPLTIKVCLAKYTDLQNRFLWFSHECSYDVFHDFSTLRDRVLNRELRFTRQSNDVSQTTLATATKLENAQNLAIGFTFDIPSSPFKTHS